MNESMLGLKETSEKQDLIQVLANLKKLQKWIETVVETKAIRLGTSWKW